MGRGLAVRRLIAFTISSVLVLVLAFEGGGYDVADRHQIGLVVWAAITLAIAFGVLPRSVPTPTGIAALIGFAALAGVTALSLRWTESDERTVEELGRVVTYAGFVTLAYLGLSRYTARAAAIGISAAVLLLPVFSLTSRLAPGLLSDDVASVLGVDRLSYPLGYWNALACWAAMAIAIGLVWSVQANRALFRCLAAALVPAAILTVYLTYSRAGVAAVALAVLAALAFSKRRWSLVVNSAAAGVAGALVILVARQQDEIAHATGSGGAGEVVLVLVAGAALCAGVAAIVPMLGLDGLRLRRDLAIVTTIAAALLVGIVAATVFEDTLQERWDEFRNESTPVRSQDPEARLSSLGGARYPAWDAALEAFSADPARGLGAGSFEFWWAREGDEPEFFRDAHSLYFEMLAELGLWGLLSLLLALGAGVWAGLQTLRSVSRPGDVGAGAAMLAAFTVFAFYAMVDWIWEMPALVIIGVGGLAVAGAAGFNRLGERRLPTVTRPAAAVAAFCAAVVLVPSLVSLERLRASATELRAGNPAVALGLADDSIDAAPFAASPYVQRALVNEARRRLDLARFDLEEAIEREPTNWRHHVLLARIAARAGDRAAMQRELREVRRLSPNSIYLSELSGFRPELTALLKQSGG